MLLTESISDQFWRSYRKKSIFFIFHFLNFLPICKWHWTPKVCILDSWTTRGGPCSPQCPWTTEPCFRYDLKDDEPWRNYKNLTCPFMLNWSKTSVRSDVLAQSEALAPESVLLTDVLAPPGINHQPQTTNHQVTKSTSKCRASRATSCSPRLFRKDKALATSKWSVSQSASANIVLRQKKTSYSICSLAID